MSTRLACAHVVLCLVGLSPPIVRAAADAPATQAARSARTVTIEGPVTGGSKGHPFSSSTVPLAPAGYTENEYFISGTAHAFAPAPGSVAGQDGRWSAVASGGEQPYKTRILVRIPDRAHFNGTVLVEWMQELRSVERDINFRWNAETMLRHGFAWVGVSLQHEGVDGDTGVSLKRWDPVRYGSLTIPNSDLSYDILSQVGAALGPARVAQSVDPLDGLPVKHIVAVGNSLSAWRLSTYIDAVQPTSHVFDGFFLQDFRQKTIDDREDAAFPHDRWVRSDVAVPTILLNMMPAALRSAGQPTGPNLRIWEPAGASHTNTFLMARGEIAEKRDVGFDIPYCAASRANGIPTQYFSSAALVALDRWVKGGKAAPGFSPITVDAQGARIDDAGNALGGMRHPWVDVPVARYTWDGDCIGGSGRTFPFSPAQLAQRYGSPAGYLKQFTHAVRAAVRAGTILPEDMGAAINDARETTW
ncbi:alpha/beta hydrolase domain-containing protein [Burkholderia anthina]|uniref:alpha/beta hydrolase domain-containing protein n=1 Tax=Burkholderia anthina TaxID=179879 RepID=UPI0015882F77|nr:alpha/beta hydrolase domain-containing protein [Burkholderia anthina]